MVDFYFLNEEDCDKVGASRREMRNKKPNDKKNSKKFLIGQGARNSSVKKCLEIKECNSSTKTASAKC